MSTLYVISHTNTALNDILLSRTVFDGPGATVQSTNLTLYGPDSVEYGDGFDTNFLHLLENFSSPGIGVGSPAVYGPNPTYFDPTYAQTGQAWFNSSINKLSVFNGTDWDLLGRHSSGPVAPTGKQLGDTWYDSAATSFKVLESTGPDVWTASSGDAVLRGGDTMTGLLILSGDPVAALGAATMQYVDTMLPLAGGSMDSAANVTFSGGGEVLGLPATPSATGAASKEYVDNNTLTLQDVYPVGAVYISASSTNPNTVFGFGTWTARQDAFLVGAGGTYAGAATGGRTDSIVVQHGHTPTDPTHRHSFTAQQNIGGYTDNGGAPDQRSAAAGSNTGYASTGITIPSNNTVLPNSGETVTTGANQNLPPYLAVYIWERTA
jgi:hypothetical protein